MNRFHRPLQLTVLTICVIGAMAGPAQARPYTVVSCDSASVFGHGTSAWVPYGNAGRSYATCPSNAGLTAGISNRLVDETFSGFDHSGHYLAAPAGATITQIRWSGRMARAGCRWGTFIRAVPSGASVLGYRNGQLCDATDFDNRNWPLSVSTPAGTTRLDQLVICGSDLCAPGATLHSQTIEVTIDDPVPPSVSRERTACEWTVGERAGGQPSRTQVLPPDNAGIQRIQATLGPSTEAQPYACNWSQPRPCPQQAAASLDLRVAELADGRHTASVAALDAAGNATTTP